MNAKKTTTADEVRGSVVRRPTGASAAARAASTFQGGSAASAGGPADDMVRLTIQLQPELRTALKRRALDEGTTMSDLIRAAVTTCLQGRTADLVAESMPYRRTKAGARTTADLPRKMYRKLKLMAVEHDTTMQALILAAILRTYPTRR